MRSIHHPIKTEDRRYQQRESNLHGRVHTDRLQNGGRSVMIVIIIAAFFLSLIITLPALIISGRSDNDANTAFTFYANSSEDEKEAE